MQWPLTLTYLQGHSAWLDNKTAKMWHILLSLLYIMYGSGWISWHQWSLVWEDVSHKMNFDLDLHLQCYLAAMLPNSWILFMCGTNTTHEEMMCHAPFPGQLFKGKGHTGHSHFHRGQGVCVYIYIHIFISNKWHVGSQLHIHISNNNCNLVVVAREDTVS